MPKVVKAIRVGKANGLEIDGKVAKTKRATKAKVQKKAARKAEERRGEIQEHWRASLE